MKKSTAKNLKIAVINFSGNVGKTTIARNLLAPRLNSPVIAIESINQDGQESEMLRAKQFGELSEALPILDSIVVDVGASNSEEFVNYMTQYVGSHQDFDLFVIPVTPSQKQIKDTIATAIALNEIGVLPTKIRILFNQVEPDMDTSKVFAPVFAYANDTRACVVGDNLKLYRNDIYGRIAGKTKNISDYAQDKTDYKSQISTAEDKDTKLALSAELSNKRLADGVILEHDSVFISLVEGL